MAFDSAAYQENFTLCQETGCPVVDLGLPGDQRDIDFYVINDLHHHPDKVHGLDKPDELYKAVDGRQALDFVKNLAAYLNETNNSDDPKVLIVNGDLIKRTDHDTDLDNLTEIVDAIREEFTGWNIVFTPGNHDLENITRQEWEEVTGYPGESFGLIAGSWHVPCMVPVYNDVPKMKGNKHYLEEAPFILLREWTRKAADKTDDMFALCHTRLKNLRVHELFTEEVLEKHPAERRPGNLDHEKPDTRVTVTDHEGKERGLIKGRKAVKKLAKSAQNKLQVLIGADEHEDMSKTISINEKGTKTLEQKVGQASLQAINFNTLAGPARYEQDLPGQVNVAGNYQVMRPDEDGKLSIESYSLATVPAQHLETAADQHPLEYAAPELLAAE